MKRKFLKINLVPLFFPVGISITNATITWSIVVYPCLLYASSKPPLLRSGSLFLVLHYPHPEIVLKIKATAVLGLLHSQISEDGRTHFPKNGFYWIVGVERRRVTMLRGFALSTFGGRSAPRGGRLLVRGRIPDCCSPFGQLATLPMVDSPPTLSSWGCTSSLTTFSGRFSSPWCVFVNLIHFESNESLGKYIWKVGPLHQSPAVTQQGIQ